MKNKLCKTGLIIFLSIALSGCTVIFQSGRRSDVDKIEELSQQLDELNQAKKLLESALSKEIQDKQVKLEMMEKGLVITVLGDVLFDSGKAKIRPQSFPILDKVAAVLKNNDTQRNVGKESHTDKITISNASRKKN